MDSITEIARSVLSKPKQDRLALINAHPDPEALKAEILRLWAKHRTFIVHAAGRSFTMIPSEPMTLDEALEHARGQFGADRVDRVIGKNTCKPAPNKQ